MNQIRPGSQQTRHGAARLWLAIFLCSLPLGCAGDATMSPAGDPSTVQERAVSRAQLDTMTPAKTVPASAAPGPVPIVVPTGATFEPDYKYPWVVRMNGCGGVLLDPQWVLTAAHCVTPRIGFGQIMYKRTDRNGAVRTDTRAADPHVGPANNRGVFIHPQYDPAKDQANDIALIKLASPFYIEPLLQTVGLPKFSRSSGLVGTLANFAHNTMVPAGQVAVFRAPLPPVDQYTNMAKIYITAMAANASLCQGDSGSGFVTVEYGRAVVRGIASQANTTNCTTPNGEAVFTDVHTFRGWILQTMGKSEASLAGNTRVRWSGFGGRGKLVMGCSNPITPYVGPLDVVGVEEGANCDGGKAQGIMCQLDANQPNSRFGSPQIVGFTMRTTMANGTSEVKALPFVSNLAQFADTFPAGATREFTCQISNGISVSGPGGLSTGVLSRGVEGTQPDEPIVEQPSPFDPSEEPKP